MRQTVTLHTPTALTNCTNIQLYCCVPMNTDFLAGSSDWTVFCGTLLSWWDKLWHYTHQLYSIFTLWGYPHCSAPSSAQFCARQHSNSLSLSPNLLSRYPVITHRSKPSAVSHHDTSTSQLHSTCHAYQICQLTNGRAGQTARSLYKKGHVFNRSFNAYTKKAHQQGPAAPSSGRTSLLPHQGGLGSSVHQEGPVCPDTSRTDSQPQFYKE
jgi:hypothetical protein